MSTEWYFLFSQGKMVPVGAEALPVKNYVNNINIS